MPRGGCYLSWRGFQEGCDLCPGGLLPILGRVLQGVATYAPGGLLPKLAWVPKRVRHMPRGGCYPSWRGFQGCDLCPGVPPQTGHGVGA